jgi:hypothetical protein
MIRTVRGTLAAASILAATLVVGCGATSRIDAEEVQSAFQQNGLRTAIMFDRAHPSPNETVGGIGGSGGFERVVAEVTQPGTGTWDIEGAVFKNERDAETYCRSFLVTPRSCVRVRNVSVMYGPRTRRRAKAAIADLRALP